MATIEYAARTDMGRVRKNNEDNYVADNDTGLFAVADGMGGHNSGEVASKLAVDVISKNVRQALETSAAEPDKTQVLFGQNNPALSSRANHLISAIRLANQVIYESSHTYAQNNGMGTTVVSTLVRDNTYTIAWVGDSRLYLARHGHLQQLTVDHSLVQEQVNKGLISSAQAEESELKNILTRALGSAENVEVDAVEIDAFDDDYLILCSDGLSRMVSDDGILTAVKAGREPKEICDRLIEQANEAGGRDNVTVIVLHRKAQRFWDKLLNK